MAGLSTPTKRMTPAQALDEAQHLYETRRPTGWRTFTLQGIRVADRVGWYERQVRRAYPHLDWEEAERCFYGDLSTVLSYVNGGHDPNLTGDLRMTFRLLCKRARKVAERIHNEDPVDLNRRLAIFGLK